MSAGELSASKKYIYYKNSSNPTFQSVDAVTTVKLGNIFYEYIRLPCVELAYFSNGRVVANKRRESGYCANDKLPVAKGGCCGEGGAGSNTKAAYIICDQTYEYLGELTTFATVVERCVARAQNVCPTNIASEHAHAGPDFFSVDNACRTNPATGVSAVNMDRYWMSSSCNIQAKVNADGSISVVHGMPEWKTRNKRMQEVAEETSVTSFVPLWGGGGAPAAGLYNTTVRNVAGFSTVAPTVGEIEETLLIGAWDVAMWDEGVYFERAELSTSR